MRILSLSLDRNLFDSQSAVAERTLSYGSLVNLYHVIVQDKKDNVLNLSEQVIVFGSGGSNKIWRFFKIYHLVCDLSKKFKYDIITTQDQYYLGFLALILSKKLRLGLEVQVHGWDNFWGLRYLLARIVLPRAKTIRTVGERSSKKLVGLGISNQKIVVVPIFTDYLNFLVANKQKSNSEKFVFLTVGRLVKVKNIQQQILCFAQLSKQFRNIELRIVGDGPERNKLEKIVANLNLKDKILFTGWLNGNELNREYENANCFLLTSKNEGWGLVIVEAANYSLPIIMTDVGCAGEFIKDGENGLVIEINNNELLLKKMKEILENKDLAFKLGQAAQHSVVTMPSKEETLALYKKSWVRALK
ncbi:MAG: Glycosyltransferase [Candidatus Magasanikbacteria bacterium GW2011_GWC2_37_14]|uniref:Glycosyltransferase n=1 Tax=Candidatus Magasanikbacteria bacterium GW2011_GWC2_37_14 TaxID=1619046 RepID=A0A0G0GD27_9BACT|nr:MAG: Glycosyltransferase [Candidatus Magasanikbacteria bacterium GW2011_GWC2_37_14]